jgi:hypothetical protein
VGVGVGDALVVLGGGLEVELVELFDGLGLVGGVEEDVSDGVGEDESDCEVLGDALPESDVLGVADVVLAARLLDDADVVADNEELLDAETMAELKALDDVDPLAEGKVLAVAAISTTFVGADAQIVVAEVVAAVVVAGVVVLAGPRAIWTPRAWLNMPDPAKASTASAPSAAALTISALTCETSLQSASWQDRPCRPYFSQYSWSG